MMNCWVCNRTRYWFILRSSGSVWAWVHLVPRPLFGLLYQHQMIDDECGAVGGTRIGKGNGNTCIKPAPIPLCSPKIPHDLAWDSIIKKITKDQFYDSISANIPTRDLRKTKLRPVISYIKNRFAINEHADQWRWVLKLWASGLQ
jgi:hypothetical protein